MRDASSLILPFPFLSQSRSIKWNEFVGEVVVDNGYQGNKSAYLARGQRILSCRSSSVQNRK